MLNGKILCRVYRKTPVVKERHYQSSITVFLSWLILRRNVKIKVDYKIRTDQYTSIRSHYNYNPRKGFQVPSAVSAGNEH